MNQDYNRDCCWTLERFSLRYNHFAIIDTDDYLADSLFVRHKVRVWFSTEFGKDDSPYRVIMCKCRKKDTPKFLDAIKELPNKMLLCGYRDYLTFCAELKNKLETAKANGGVDRNAPNGSALQTK